MKAVRIDEPGKLVIADVEEPTLANPTQVKVKITSGSICGSDLGIYKGTNSLAKYPRVIGHEYGGVVTEVGSLVDGVKPGDLVAVDPVRVCGHCYACRTGRQNVCATLEVTGVQREGGFLNYVIAPGDRVHKVNQDKITKDLVCFVEPYSIAVQVNTRGRIAKNDKVLVMGSGPIGLCITQEARARGAQVMITDIIDSRLEMAKTMGADKTVNVAKNDIKKAVDEFTGGEGMPVVVDAVCSLSSFPLALDLTCPAARVVVLGLLGKPSEVAQVAITKKELDVIGSRLSNRRFPEVIQSWENGHYTPQNLKSKSFHFTEAQKAFDLILDHPDQVIKVTLNFD